MILILVIISRNKIKSEEILKKQRQVVHIFFGYIEKCKEDAKKDYDTIRNLNTRARGSATISRLLLTARAPTVRIRIICGNDLRDSL